MTVVTAIDLFCGAGGLSQGLKESGIDVKAGYDIDPACEYPYKSNIGAPCILKDIRRVTADDLISLWDRDSVRLLAGCAPCQPFSSMRRGFDTSGEDKWNLLDEFARLVRDTRPELITMENVPRLRKMSIFDDFLNTLESMGYSYDYQVLYGPDYGLAQERRRLVLVASRVSVVKVPDPIYSREEYRTVKDVIGNLPGLKNGGMDPSDPLHKARMLNPLNLRRIQQSKPGGTWMDWPKEIRAQCQLKATGQSFKSFYGRMRWDVPSPTITTQSYNYGSGRFGHPSQDRPITLREAAMLQSFPKEYKFVADGERPTFQNVGRLIGNAVPPVFGKVVGKELLSSLNE
ncbi:DNA cytosine methyltransferase [Bifidobacterium psychraerophilum]|uniref:DNA cytosine methyltransferase n=1 Tax=Bifidobacterium psychraerophilum TaxID=218140 RepID=UPI0039E799C6